MERTLKIYRASAGSGKTFTLALEYIKLLVENPYAYRNILAVTFTNKATAEMKERILGKLYGVAHRSNSANDYLYKLKEQLSIDEETIVSNAAKALELLLHDYGHFRIQTIDAFFQSVLRSLAKELDLNGDMEISLDGEELLEDAVDTYIRGLEPETRNIAQVIHFVEEKLENSERWNVNKDIKRFAKNILNEEYQQRCDNLRKEIESDNGALLKIFYDKINERKRELVEKAKNIGERFFQYAQGHIASDFLGGKGGIWGNFEKLRGGNIIEWAKTKAELAQNPQKISSVCQAVDEIAQLITEAIPLYREFISCKMSLEHYHQLGLLNNIASTLKDNNARENRFLLAETTHLLSSMIDKNTTFIFEKIGTEIDHIFIDEFQDTSKLQWNCFRLLLEEVLARGNFNLIVGDVKQSIYRWRNSDWNIMNNIDSYFNDGMITFAKQDVKENGVVYKSTNYRSDRRIVEFNNALYRAAIKSISESFSDRVDKAGMKEIAQAYEDVEQAVPQKKRTKGYAEIRMIDKPQKSDRFMDLAIAQLMSTLHRLIEEEHVAPRDITILLRTKKGKIEPIVEAFNKEFPGLKIVSDEAYRLSSSHLLQLVISSLRYIESPNDMLNMANLTKLYGNVIGKQQRQFGKEMAGEKLSSIVSQEFYDALTQLKGLPLYELIEQIMALLDAKNMKDDEAYIYAFLDQASQYINSRSADISKFLAAWDEKIKNENVAAESIESVRIMTVHKSKGLEFHTVIVPLCDWLLTGDSDSLLWCEPMEEPFRTLSLLPISNRKEMAQSFFNKEYYNEFMYQIVDNLNILYVATTRAKSNLIMFTDKSGGRGETVSKLLNNLLENITHLNGSTYDKLEGVFTYGEIVPSEKEDKKEDEKKNDNPFETEAVAVRQPFTYHGNRITFQQSNELVRFLTVDKEEKKQFDYIAEGELMHHIMSGIEQADDVDKAIDRTMIDGLIATEKQYDRIKNIVKKALSNQKAKEWFNGTYKLYNECSILDRNEETTRRPDRVMVKGDEVIVVDYKFGKENEEHKKQVKRYMNLLGDMGYRNVKGYLWYVYKNDIKEV